MNHLAARPLADGSGWRMTVRNDDRIWTHRSCCDERPATEEDVDRTMWIYMGRLKVGDPIRDAPHAPHATEQEAQECYRSYCLGQVETTVQFDDSVFGDWTGCEVCDQPTKGGARYNADHWLEHLALCPDHRTLEHVRAYAGQRIGTEAHYS